MYRECCACSSGCAGDGYRTGGFDGDCVVDLCRCGWEVRPGSTACLAAGCDGRPDAGERVDSCGDDGRGRGVSRCAGLSVDVGGCGGGADVVDYGSAGRDLGWGCDGGICCTDRSCAG